MKRLLLALTTLSLLLTACGGAGDDSDGATAGSVGSRGAVGDAPPGVDAPGANLNFDASGARLVVTSQISLEVTDLRAAYQRTSDLARSFGGFVAEGQIRSAAETDEGDEPDSAYVRLRVPAEQHDALLQGLRDGATSVRSEETLSQEVTGEFTDLQSRLTNLQRSEAQYQELLTRSGSIDDILDVTARLDQVRGEIESVQGRINLLDDQSDFATVGVTLVVPAAAASTSSSLPSPLSVFADAAEASVVIAHGVLNLGAVVLVGLLWLIPLALAYLLLRRPLQRLLAASRARIS